MVAYRNKFGMGDLVQNMMAGLVAVWQHPGDVVVHDGHGGGTGHDASHTD